MSINNKRSYTEYAVTESTKDFLFGFSFQEGVDAVRVLVDNMAALDAGYTLRLKSEFVIELDPAVPVGSIVRIYRETDLDSTRHNFSAGALFSATSVDTNFTQLLHSQQEVRDQFFKLKQDVAVDIANFKEYISETIARVQGEQFVTLKNYVDGVFAMTNPNLFDGITDNMVIDEFGDSQRKNNREFRSAVSTLGTELASKLDTAALPDLLDKKVDTTALDLALLDTTNSYQLADAGLQNQINAFGGGTVPYLTYDAMVLDAASITSTMLLEVTNDPEKEKNGRYTYNGDTFTKSQYDPVVQSKAYTDLVIGDVAIETQYVSPQDVLTFTTDDGQVLASITDDYTARFDGVTTNRLSTAFIEEQSNTVTDAAYTITDEAGNILMAIDDEATAHFQKVAANDIAIGALDISEDAVTNHSVTTTDSEGNILSYYNSEGEFIYLGQGALKTTFVSTPRIETDIIHVSIYGQSLALGLGSTTVSTASEAPNALTPSAGIEDGQQSSVKQGINALPLTSTSLVAFNPALNPNLKENPIYGATIHLQKALDARGSTSKILPTAHGYGATAIAGLSKGTINYNVGVAQSKRYREYASARGDSCLTQFMLWVQGEADISSGLSKDAYKTALNKLLDDYQTDIDQPAMKPIMLTYQVASHTKRTPNSKPDIAYAQLECSNENPYIKMACATYPMTYYDGVHMVANSYKWMGAYFGKVIDWMLENKRTDWKPLQPEKVMRTGKVVTVYFHVPVKPLVLDTTMVTNPSNYGFTVKDASGTTLAISSVTLKGDDRVNIVLASEPTSAVTVTYALGTTGTDAGYSTGARGNLRDSDATISNTLDEDGNPYSLYNWCVLFSKQENFSWA